MTPDQAALERIRLDILSLREEANDHNKRAKYHRTQASKAQTIAREADEEAGRCRDAALGLEHAATLMAERIRRAELG